MCKRKKKKKVPRACGSLCLSQGCKSTYRSFWGLSLLVLLVLIWNKTKSNLFKAALVIQMHIFYELPFWNSEATLLRGSTMKIFLNFGLVNTLIVVYTVKPNIHFLTLHCRYNYCSYYDYTDGQCPIVASTSICHQGARCLLLDLLCVCLRCPGRICICTFQRWLHEKAKEQDKGEKAECRGQ